MKRIISWMLVTAFLLSVAACTKTPDKPVDTPTPPTQSEPDKAPEPERYAWVDDLPRMDGSTSTIPLEAGIRAALFGISQAEAELQVKHATTYGSFNNLINGKCDLIFSVPLSEEQVKQAADKGMELEMTAVAAEGFVFVVNAKNPVDTLTQQQLRDIYSGKITNWSEVGGNDAPIVAYQRNETSGSQNFMHTFMGDTPLMDPLTIAHMVPQGMGQLMDAVAYYDNAENALGYSVYAYAADMYGNGNEIKFIHVDGVQPSKATMADGSYPLLSYNYAVYDKAAPADSSLRKLVEWIVSDEGQQAVKAAGYVPLRPVGEMTEDVLKLYAATGTGKPKPAGHKPAAYRYEVAISDDMIDALQNDELQAEIEAFIRQSEEDMRAVRPEGEWSMWTSTQCINGYLAVQVEGHLYGENGPYDLRTALYDVVEDRRIAFSDLFYEGEEFVPALNETIIQALSINRDEISKRTFSGIPAGYDDFTLSYINFPRDNPYFEEAVAYRFSFRRNGEQMVLFEPRDMQGVFDDRVTVVRTFWQESPAHTQEPLVHEYFYAELLDEKVFSPALCQRANGAIRAFCRENLTKEAVAAWHNKTCCDEEFGPYFGGMDLYYLGNRYICSTGGVHGYAFNEETYEEIPHSYNACLLFDAESGKEVSYTVFLKAGWEKNSRWQVDGTPCEPMSLRGARLSRLSSEGEGLVLLFDWDKKGQPTVWVYVPDAYVNWEL